MGIIGRLWDFVADDADIEAEQRAIKSMVKTAVNSNYDSSKEAICRNIKTFVEGRGERIKMTAAAEMAEIANSCHWDSTREAIIKLISEL